MKTGWKSSIAMIVKILVILILPLILFRYVDSQPAAVVNEAPEEAVRSIAIVNEDNGYVLNDEVVTLSSEVPLLLNEQTDYTWTVVNRSSAEQGLNSKTYDAVIYIPSGFSENIMSFNQKSPERASINFVIQPSLDAKNRQRVQKEMAIAKNNINREMTTIYWSYVSQEIEFIREQFDNILEKEIDFQNAMYSFYAPSSRTLAQEIEQHKNGLESILSQTENIDEQSQNSVDMASEAKERIAEFAQALDAYKKHQMEQRELLDQFQVENKAALDTGVTDYETVMAEKIEEINNQIAAYKSPVFLENAEDDLATTGDLDTVTNGFGEIMGFLNEGQNAFDEWKLVQDNLEDIDPENEKRLRLFEMSETLLTLYNKNLLDDGKINIESSAGAIRNDESEEEDLDPEIEVPENVPDPLGGINIQPLVDNANSLRALFNKVKPSEPEPDPDPNPGPEPVPDPEPTPDPEQGESLDETTNPDSLESQSTSQGTDELQGDENESNPSEPEENPTPSNDWDKIGQGLDALDTSIGVLDQSIQGYQEQHGKWVDYSNDWKAVAEQWEDAYHKLKFLKTELTTTLVNNIMTKQEGILEHPVLNGEDENLLGMKEQLNEIFFDKKQDLRNKDITLLIGYGDSLSVFHKTLDQKSSLTDELMEIFVHEDMQDQRKELMKLDEQLRNSFNTMFNDLSGTEESAGKVSLVELSFNNLVLYTEKFLADYETLIQGEFEKIQASLKDMSENANRIAGEIREVNSEEYEWEESPSLGMLDEQMVVNIHDGTLSGLQQLSESVGSLDESQGNITGSTSELQTMVGEVQQRSDDLNTRWATNVNSTELVRGDVHEVLANTFIDGQENPFVYNHLANPVNVEGKTGGQVLSETENRLPPVIMLIAILISGLLIGFISQFYSNSNYLVQSGLFILLNLAVGLIISIYGLNIYNLGDAVSIQWSMFTILLLFATSNIVRAGLFINTFVGWLAGIALIVFFITPMIDIVVPDFNFNNPIANAYMGLQYGMDSPYVLTMVILGIITLLVSAFIYTLQVMRKKPKVVQDEKAAA